MWHVVNLHTIFHKQLLHNTVRKQWIVKNLTKRKDWKTGPKLSYKIHAWVLFLFHFSRLDTQQCKSSHWKVRNNYKFIISALTCMGEFLRSSIDLYVKFIGIPTATPNLEQVVPETDSLNNKKWSKTKKKLGLSLSTYLFIA